MPSLGFYKHLPSCVPTCRHTCTQFKTVLMKQSVEAHWHILCSVTEYCFSLQEEDGREEVLFTHNHQVSHSTSFKGRVRLGADYGLYLSPVQIQDDGRTFSCHLSASPLKVWKTSTTVKVFGKEFALWSLCHPVSMPLACSSHERNPHPHPGPILNSSHTG